jgi:DNA polymerase-3 subunit gamma/tau
MAYQALYRRLRPQRFEDVVGQRHIIQALTNQINENRINHAYLFCGTRGTGKTTTAKIFARAVNCNSDGTKPCNECEVCRDILSGRSANVIEIDAASYTGVDNVRDIIEDIKYPPAVGNYKVYIIDEVHMFSNSAFNALLKTLEEPPEYVIFILATTDPQKLPVTVLSRCQRFDFHRISKRDMLEVLKKDMSAENVDIDDDALDYITSLSDGAMRDALSVLDQCISFYYGEKITADMVREVTGSADNDAFFNITTAISQNDSAAALSVINEVSALGRDIQQFTVDLIAHIRNILLSLSLNGESKALDHSPEYIEKLKKQGEDLSYSYAIKLISMFSELLSQMRYSSNPRVLLEVCCIKACNPVTENDAASLEMRIQAMEKTIAEQKEKIESTIKAEIKAMPAQVSAMPTAQATSPQQVQNTEPEEIPISMMQKIVPDEVKEVVDQWKNFLKARYKPSLELTVLLGHCKAAYLENEFVNVVCEDEYIATVNGYKDKLHERLSQHFGRNIPVQIMTKSQHQRRHKELYQAEDADINKKADLNDIIDFFGSDMEVND